MDPPANDSEHLIKVFRSLDDATREALANIQLPLHAGLAALVLAHDRGGMEFLSLEDMELALEHAGVAFTQARLGKALARAGNRVTSKKRDGRPYYKVMTPGRREVEPLLQTGNISVMYIDGEKPRTSRKNLAEILGELAGTVRVCDPWYGVRSLESLEMIRAENEVRFLTARTNENLARLTGPLKDFKTERPRTELRRVQNAGELHDRYVLGEQLLLIVGHGLKDIGGKQSFIITVPKALAPDLIAQVRTAFDEKWKTAVPL